MNQTNSLINLSAYNGVESLTNYSNQQELEAYRNESLEFFSPVGKFIKENCGKEKIRIIEIGSGNSSLLYWLDLNNVLEKGVAVEVSKTRHEFAELWRIEHGFQTVTNIHSDFTAVELGEDCCDMFVCNGTFHLLKPVDNSYPEKLIATAFKALKKGGCLFLDIPNYYPRIKRMLNNELTFWVELPESNPFAYGLYKLIHFSDAGLLESESTYLSSDGSKKSKKELACVYSVLEVKQLLLEAGFGRIDVFGSLDKEPFGQDVSQRMLILAGK